MPEGWPLHPVQHLPHHLHNFLSSDSTLLLLDRHHHSREPQVDGPVMMGPPRLIAARKTLIISRVPNRTRLLCHNLSAALALPFLRPGGELYHRA